MRFLTNLKKPSLEFYEEIQYRPHSWLLSSHRATATNISRAHRVRRLGFDLMADNGTIAYIRDSEELFDDKADLIQDRVREFKRQLPNGRRVPYMTEVPADIRESMHHLAEQINNHVDTIFKTITPESQINIQLSMDPTQVIAKEDWSVSTALGLGLEREMLGWPVSRYLTRNRRSLEAWSEMMQRGETSGMDVYVTMAATDYTTAKAVGRQAGDWGVENVALGFAGLNKTPGYTDVTFYRHRHRLNQPGPRRYVRLAEIVTGFRDGYRDSKTTLQNFHALGLGARAMWNILAAGLDWWTDISVDATSAIKDAEGRAPVVYHPDLPAIRVSVASLADIFVTTGELPFESPVLLMALEALPCDRKKALEMKISLGLEKISHDDLRTGQSLAGFLPVFANGGGTSQAGNFLAHHNYWASDLYASKVPTRGRKKWAIKQLEQIVANRKASITVRNGCKAALEIL